MLGMKNYMDGVTGSFDIPSEGDGIKDVAGDLGLIFDTQAYIILGVVLFFGILLAIAIALVLGLFAEDAKSAQGVISPLMVLILIPYLLTMFMDINTMAPAVKYFIYAIPFSHLFLAAPNILLGNYQFVLWGILYLLVLFIIFVFIAAKIFSSDKIMTLRLNFGKKK